MQENLRTEVKLLKALHGISYTEIAEYIEVKRSSFYSWLKGQYEFSDQKKELLIFIIESLKGE